MAATGAEIASAYVALTVKMPGVGSDVARALGGSDVQSALDSGGKSMGAALTGAIGGAVAVATSKAVGLIMRSIDNAVKRVDIMNNFPKIMKNLGYSTKDATKSINKMSDGLKGLPTALDAMAGTVQQLAPLTGGLDEATNLSLALNNALLAGGKSADYQANAMEQYTQMLAIGKVDMAAWRSMVSAMPGQMDQLSVSLLGVGNNSMDLYDAMKSGEVTFDDFNEAILALNSEGVGSFASFEKQARDSTDGIATGWANLQTAITRNLANIIQKLKPAIDAFMNGATQIANALGPVIVSVIDVVAAVTQWAVANKDWLVPALAVVGAIIAYRKAVALVSAVKVAYAAASYGEAAATYASGLAAKVGAAAYAIQNSSLVRLIASLRANEALSLRSKVAIVASTVATKAAAVAQRAWNAAVSGNPLGIIITAVVAMVGALIWFFTKTETGKKIWAEFTRFLGEAWANISQFFQDTWNNVLKPVFEAIGQVFKFVWESILKPVFDGIAAVAKWVFENILLPLFLVFQFAFAVLGGIIVGVYEAFIKPAFDAIGAVFKWIYENIIVPVVEGIKLYVKAWALIIMWLWENVVQPVFAAIGQAFTWIWENVIRPVIDWIVAYFKVWGAIFTWLWENAIKPTVDAIANVFRWLWDNVIKPVWDGIYGTIKSVWDKIKSVIDILVKVVKSDPKRAFEAARDGIKTAWDAIKEIAAKPVRFVVQTVLNDGLIGTINKIPGVNIPKIALPKGFARGGILPGMSRMSDGDDQLIMARRGEGMMVSEALRTSADRSAFLAANAAGRRGIGFASLMQGLARGGLVHPLPGAVVTTTWMGYPGHTGIDLAKPQGTPIQAAGPGTVSKQFYHVNYGNMVDIDHGGGLSTRYAHMLANVQVALGQAVKAGQVIGYEGSTGNSTGPHLHYEVLLGGNAVDPAPYLTGGGVKPLFGIIDGLMDFATGTFNKAFPGGGMWVDAAGGVMKQGVKNIIDWATDLLSVGGGGIPTLYDNGGWLPPGRSWVENKTGRPEPILTGSQWQDIRSRRDGTVYVQNPFTGKYLLAKVDERADDAVDRGFRDMESESRRASYAQR